MYDPNKRRKSCAPERVRGKKPREGGSISEGMEEEEPKEEGFIRKGMEKK